MEPVACTFIPVGIGHSAPHASRVLLPSEPHGNSGLGALTVSQTWLKDDGASVSTLVTKPRRKTTSGFLPPFPPGLCLPSVRPSQASWPQISAPPAPLPACVSSCWLLFLYHCHCGHHVCSLSDRGHRLPPWHACITGERLGPSPRTVPLSLGGAWPMTVPQCWLYA